MVDKQMVDKQMEVAKIGRAIRKMHGVQRVCNNSYKSGTRTGKCYCNRRGELPVGRLAAISHGLSWDYFKTSYTVNFTKGTMFGAPGFIVKIYR